MHSIAPYSLSISDADLPAATRHRRMNDIRGKSLHEIFLEFIKKHSNEYSYITKDGHKHAFRFSDCNIQEGLIYGFLETGGSGKRGRIIDTNSSEIYASYGASHANTTRKFFTIKYEPDATNAYLYIHQISGDGAKSQLHEQLNSHIKEANQQLTAKIETLTFESALKKWREQAEVKEVRGYYLKSADTQSDTFNGLRDNHKLEVICRPPRRGLTFGSLLNFSNKTDVQKLVAFENLEATEIKVTINLDGKTKTMTLFSRKEPICNIDFTTDDVEFDDGEPKIDSILQFCLELNKGMER